jgi:hypothetical protein
MSASRLRNVRHRLRTAAAQEALRRSGPILDKAILALDYAPNAANVRRYFEPHPRLDRLIAASEDRYRQTLATIGEYKHDLAQITVQPAGEIQPFWVNGFIPGLDGAAIYALLRSWAPATYIEVGSGNSTKFAAKAKTDGALGTRIISIDPTSIDQSAM